MTLNIENSAKLYKLLKPFFPENTIENVLELSSTIIDNIIQADEHDKFLHIAMLLTGKRMDELLLMETNEFIVELVQSLVDNHILDMMQIYRNNFDG